MTNRRGPAIALAMGVVLLLGAGCGQRSMSHTISHGGQVSAEPTEDITEVRLDEWDTEELMRRTRPKMPKEPTGPSCSEAVGGAVVTVNEEGEKETEYWCGPPPSEYQLPSAPHGPHGYIPDPNGSAE